MILGFEGLAQGPVSLFEEWFPAARHPSLRNFALETENSPPSNGKFGGVQLSENLPYSDPLTH